MPLKSRWNIEIPKVTLPSLLFTSPTHPLPDVDVFFDAECPEKRLSLNDFRLWSQRFAVGLRHAGLQDGDRVLLFSPNNIFFPVVFMGVIMAGGIFTGANPSYMVREVAHHIRVCEPRFLLCAPSSLKIGLEAALQTSMSQDQVFMFSTDPDTITSSENCRGCSHWSSLIGSIAEGQAFRWKGSSTPEEECQKTIVLNSSSGTTGLPKCVEITHYAYVANALLIEHINDLPPDSPFRQGLERWLCFLPLHHAMGQTVFIAVALRRRVPVYIMSQFHFTKMLDCIQKFRITKLVAVPSILVTLAKDPRIRRGDWDLSSVWQISSGAAPLANTLMEEVQKNWSGMANVRMSQGYGMTELTCGALFNYPSRHPYVSPPIDSLSPEAPLPPDGLSVISAPSSVGELAANCEAKLMNDSGTAEVPRGTRGELWIRGPIIMKGYWRNEAATREVLTDDGWLITGDICYVDRDNQFHIVDRKKDLIKVSSYQVAPAELEALLLTHPAVLDAAVVGIPSANGTEQPRAFVVRRDIVPTSTSPRRPAPVTDAARMATGSDEPTLAREIEAWVAARVHKTKRLTGGVKFVAALPKGPTGKVIRRVLRERRGGKEGQAKL